MTDSDILDKIKDCGGTIAYSSMSGWLGDAGGLGLNIKRVRTLAKAGKLIAMTSVVMKKTARSRGIGISITSFSLV